MDGGKTLRVDNPQAVVFFSGEEEFVDFKRRKGVLKAATSELHDSHTPALSMVLSVPSQWDLSFYNYIRRVQRSSKQKETCTFSLDSIRRPSCVTRKVKDLPPLCKNDFVYLYFVAFQSGPNDPTKAILLSNRAECLLRTYDFRSALSDACAAMELDPSHLKSRHRRCKVFISLLFTSILHLYLLC